MQFYFDPNNPATTWHVMSRSFVGEAGVVFHDGLSTVGQLLEVIKGAPEVWEQGTQYGRVNALNLNAQDVLLGGEGHNWETAIKEYAGQRIKPSGSFGVTVFQKTAQEKLYVLPKNWVSSKVVGDYFGHVHDTPVLNMQYVSDDHSVILKPWINGAHVEWAGFPKNIPEIKVSVSEILNPRNRPATFDAKSPTARMLIHGGRLEEGIRNEDL